MRGKVYQRSIFLVAYATVEKAMENGNLASFGKQR
jgi:hypothetical protein